MSTLTAALTVAGVVAVGVLAVWWQIRAAVREESRKDRIVREATVHDVGPDSLRLLKDLDLHLNLYLVDHRDIAEGLARLDQAARDHTNTPEGDA
jgi:hypothetical protein